MKVVSLLVAVYLSEMFLARLYSVCSFFPYNVYILSGIRLFWLYGAQYAMVEFEVLSCLVSKRSHYNIFSITSNKRIKNIELLEGLLLSVVAVSEA